jgi:hypothetical protein
VFLDDGLWSPVIYSHNLKEVATMSDSASSLPTADQILSALDQTGFVLEYRVAQALQKLGFYTYLNQPFTDPQSGKSREIDVLAETYNNVREDDLHKALINATLVVECKNYQDPLLTIGQGNQSMFHNDKPLITFDPLEFDFTNARRRLWWNPFCAWPGRAPF